MIAISLTTPALLFPAISLLLVAYTNRYLALSSIVRSLYKEHLSAKKTGEDTEQHLRQIAAIRPRIKWIVLMQKFGVLALLTCTLTMVFSYFNQHTIAAYLFAIALFSMALSLIISLLELRHSSNALNILLSDIEDDIKQMNVKKA